MTRWKVFSSFDRPPYTLLIWSWQNLWPEQKQNDNHVCKFIRLGVNTSRKSTHGQGKSNIYWQFESCSCPVKCETAKGTVTHPQAALSMSFSSIPYRSLKVSGSTRQKRGLSMPPQPDLHVQYMHSPIYHCSSSHQVLSRMLRIWHIC